MTKLLLISGLAMHLSPASPQSTQDILNRAGEQLDQKEYGEAAASLTALMKQKLSREEEFLVYELHARACLGQGELTRAKSDIDRAIKKKSTDAGAYLLRAGILNRLGDCGRALEDMDQAAVIDPYNANIYAYRGLMKLYRLSYYFSAINDFTRALELDSSKAGYFFFRGLAYYKATKYAQAVEDFNTYLDKGSDPEKACYARLFTWYFGTDGQMVQISAGGYKDEDIFGRKRAGYFSFLDSRPQPSAKISGLHKAHLYALYNKREDALRSLREALGDSSVSCNVLLSDNNLYSIMYSEEFNMLLKKYGCTGRVKRQEEFISDYVQSNLEDWKIKREFETTEEYKARIRKTGARKEDLERLAVKCYKNIHRQSVDFTKFIIHPYDADKQQFRIEFLQAGSIDLTVPREQAGDFRKYQSGLQFNNPDFVLKKGKWILSYLEVFSTHDSSTFVYGTPGNKRPRPAIATTSPEEKSPTAEPIQPFMEDERYDIETELPHNRMDYSDDYAVVIGNKDYAHFNDVDYAINDARTIKKYLLNVLGFEEDHIYYKENAVSSDFQKLFGSANDNNGWLKRVVTPGQTKLFIFYSGHGAPGLNDEKAYFLPSDCEKGYVEQQGFCMDVFYKNLAGIQAARKYVVIDACFSGAGIYKNISSVVIAPKVNYNGLEKMAVITSSKENQVALWCEEKKHGLLTYFFLKAIHNRNADLNHDRKLTFGEIANYISDKNNGIPAYARRKGIDQYPSLLGGLKDEIFIKY